MRILCIGHISGDTDVIVDHTKRTIEKAYPLSFYDVEAVFESDYTLSVYLKDLERVGGYTRLENEKPLISVE